MYFVRQNNSTISVEQVDGISVVKANVTDFTDAVGYCEYKIPFFAKNVYVKTADMQKGEEHHEQAEKIERLTAIPVPLKIEQLQDLKQDLNFFREDIRAIYVRDYQSMMGKAQLVLYGRADKIMRKESTLIISDDKSTDKPFRHDGREVPFLDQRLQVLTYLHSIFYFGKTYGGWVEIPHSEKMYQLNIVDRKTKQIYKTYQEVVGGEHASLLEKHASQFTFKCLQWLPLQHHNNKNKCTPCGYKECTFRLK